jgi:NAD(P)-dependent dehydrogenase (short-subunit alcohol dehydrogenase family)
MIPRPKSDDSTHQGTGKLFGKVALITGGDSGIGRAVAISFAREGADIVILYLDEHHDAKETATLVEKEGRRCVAMAGDVGTKAFCNESVKRTMAEFGHLDILVNNAAEQHPQDCITKISPTGADVSNQYLFVLLYDAGRASPPESGKHHYQFGFSDGLQR